MDLSERYPPIADYALIGDCHSAALVRKDGSIDWACLRRFDSGSVFARLLDADQGGHFSLCARDLRSTRRRYLPDTNVLETTFLTQTGEAVLYDCFTMRRGGRQRPFRQLLRIARGVRGEVTFDAVVAPRFDYGEVHPWLRFHPEVRLYTAVGGDDAFVMQSDCDLAIDRDQATLVGSFAVSPGRRCRLSIIACAPHEMPRVRWPVRELDRRLRATIAWWRAWVKKGVYGSEFREPLVRSALTLKALTCAPTGAIIAAPTTSLPEEVGGTRNWDYRYSWVRDSTFTLAALLAIGHPEVATGFKAFIERATSGRAADLQIVYGCYGERRLTELELGLEGYRRSSPVRVGNGAARQFQLDVFGELLDAAHLWRKAGTTITGDGWLFLSSLVEMACKRWREPDRGLWEMRGEPRHYVYSKVMCWVAVDRGIAAAEETGLACDLDGWRKERVQIRRTIEQEGIDPARNCFVQAFGSRELDASLLRLPLVGFVAAGDPRMRATVEAIRADLTWDGLVRRYRTESGVDGIAGGEGAFLMASFWLVDVLAMQGELTEARRLFEQLLGLGSDLGLYAEEYDPRAREMLGNFPQAFTHTALINSAEQLRRAALGGTPDQLASERAQDRVGAACIARHTPHHDHRARTTRKPTRRQSARR